MNSSSEDVRPMEISTPLTRSLAMSDPIMREEMDYVQIPSEMQERRHFTSVENTDDDRIKGLLETAAFAQLFTPTRNEDGTFRAGFESLTKDIRKEIWQHINNDKTYSIASRVSKTWNMELMDAWDGYCRRRGFFDDLETWKSKGKDWKWVVLMKTNVFTDKDTNKNGPGRLEEFNGVYEGDWKNNKKEGLGKKLYLDKSYYIGQWHNDKKNGQGAYIWGEDGTRYVGGWKDDKYHDFGTKSWANGDRYEGHWRDNKKHGTGTYKWATGDCYTGDWMNGQQHGRGTFEWTTGAKYVGSFKNNMRNNIGVFQWSNGDRYEGSFVDNMRDGKGTYLYACGDKYDGEWKSNDRHGFAVYSYHYGGKFIGMFKEDERHGEGCFEWPDGDRFVGEWRSGGRFGTGKLIPKGSTRPVVQGWNEPPHQNYSTKIPAKWPEQLQINLQS